MSGIWLINCSLPLRPLPKSTSFVSHRLVSTCDCFSCQVTSDRGTEDPKGPEGQSKKEEARQRVRDSRRTLLVDRRIRHFLDIPYFSTLFGIPGDLTTHAREKRGKKKVPGRAPQWPATLAHNTPSWSASIHQITTYRSLVVTQLVGQGQFSRARSLSDLQFPILRTRRKKKSSPPFPSQGPGLHLVLDLYPPPLSITVARRCSVCVLPV